MKLQNIKHKLGGPEIQKNPIQRHIALSHWSIKPEEHIFAAESIIHLLMKLTTGTMTIYRKNVHKMRKLVITWCRHFFVSSKGYEHRHVYGVDYNLVKDQEFFKGSRTEIKSFFHENQEK